MGMIEALKAWTAARHERRIERLTAQAADLSADQPYDLLWLYQRGLIRARATGQSITSVDAEVENLIRNTVRVVVAPGTYFISRGGHQNMATTGEYHFTLSPCDTQRIGMSAACINANRPIPTEKDRFNGVARVSEDVARFLQASRGEDPMVIQAGVWTLTDGYTRHQIIAHLVAQDRDGKRSHPVTHDHCDQAKRILERLGISHCLWYSAVPHERKTVTYDDCTYTGELRYGEIQGRGQCTWKDGRSYDGQWKRSRFHGAGELIYADGSRYVGQFDEDRPIGGWYQFPSGVKLWSRRNANGQWEFPDPPEGQP